MNKIIENLKKVEDVCLMFGSDVIKDYYVIYFDFEMGKYFVYKYLRNRKLTPKQRWDMIFKYKYETKIIETGEAFNIGKYDEIIEKLRLPEKRCEMNMHFAGGKSGY